VQAESLSRDSTEISDAVQVIKVIAQQTRPLAWNAAKEAACARQHGRSFVVDAGEVRKLAERMAKHSEGKV
jgi:methyl-accepting chemotaxis protein